MCVCVCVCVCVPGVDADRRAKVVRVHEHVDERVGERSSVAVAIDVVAQEGRGDKGDGDMMVDMEKGELTERAAHGKDDGVKVLPELLCIIKPYIPCERLASGSTEVW